MASLYVALGGGTGAVLRYQLGRLVTHWFGPNIAFPWATFTANVVGSLCMGLLVGFLARHGHGGEHWRLLLGVGMLGGFTTFSSFSMEMVLLAERGAIGMAVAYAGFSLAAGVAAMFLGLMTMRSIG
ncbi:camphor resistance protein CrcB [Croceicoccus estronivorus]|nr:camphor resistance protein CrcB [Croceicoccus estronivorus]